MSHRLKPRTNEPVPGFSLRLRIAMEKLGITVKQLADEIGVDASTVYHYECGTILPRLTQFVSLFDALDATADELLGLKSPATHVELRSADEVVPS